MSTGTEIIENNSSDIRLALVEQALNHLNQKLDSSMQQINQTFQRIDQKFDKIDERFDKVDREIKEIYKDLKGEMRIHLFWNMGALGAVLAVVAHGFHWF